MPDFQYPDRFPMRKHPRLPNYDYSTPNYYFITICTHQKKCIFGKPDRLNTLGTIAQKDFSEIETHFPGIYVDKFVVMPNHVHGIIVLQTSNHTLSTILGLYKSSVSKKIHALQPDITVWQASFHDHVIRDQYSYRRIWSYIDTNPVRWENDCFYTPQPGL